MPLPSIDFYIINQTTENERLFFACRLLEKIFHQNRKVHIHTASKESSQALSDLLWGFRPDSFLPHSIVDTGSKADSAITISVEDNFTAHADVLINLSADIPSFHSRFERIAEIVLNEETSKQNSRDHWRFYQSQGYSLKKNEI